MSPLVRIGGEGRGGGGGGGGGATTGGEGGGGGGGRGSTGGEGRSTGGGGGGGSVSRPLLTLRPRVGVFTALLIVGVLRTRKKTKSSFLSYYLHSENNRHEKDS